VGSLLPMEKLLFVCFRVHIGEQVSPSKHELWMEAVRHLKVGISRSVDIGATQTSAVGSVREGVTGTYPSG